MVFQYDYHLECFYTTCIVILVPVNWVPLGSRSAWRAKLQPRVALPRAVHLPPPIYNTILTLVIQKSYIYCDSAPYATTFHHQEVTNLETQ